ncbi:MAG: YggT family protein [Actinomycetota bacterium]
MSTVVRVVCIVLTIYWVILFARIIMSWFRLPMSGVGRTMWDIVHDLTEPVLGLVRGLLPPVRMGMMGLDLSPIIVFIALGVIQAALGCAIGF